MFHDPLHVKVFLTSLVGGVAFVTSIELYYKKRILPYKLIIEDECWQAVIHYRWLRRFHLYMAAWGIFISCAVPIGLYYRSVTVHESINYWWITLYIIVGLAMICTAIIGFLNWTVLWIRGSGIWISSQPFPTLHGQPKSFLGVKEVYYKKEFYSAKSDIGWVYTFFANTDNGQDIKLIGLIEREVDAIKVDQCFQKQIAMSRSKIKSIVK